MAYIYQIVNDINDKVYVGKTEFSIEKRFTEHGRDAFRERNENRPLYRAMKKYGIEHFHIELIEETDNPEEREIYWISEKNSYSNGYNATLGGDGQYYIDRQEVIECYLKLKNQRAVAKELGICVDTIRSILRQNNIEIFKQVHENAKKVEMYDLKDGYLQSFNSLTEAADYLISQDLTGCKRSTIKTHISEVCRGKRKTAAGFKWKFPVEE